MKRAVAFFALVFGITWGIGLLYFTLGERLAAIAGPLGTSNPLFYLAVWSPTLSAILLAAFVPGGLRDLFGRLLRWRIGWQWYVLPVFGTAALCVIARIAAASFGGPSPGDLLSKVDWSPSLLLAGAAAFVVDPGPLGEELGWRGFALPRLEQRWNGTLAAIVLGLVWGIWHLPAFYISTLPQSSFGFPLFLAQTIAMSILFAWMVNHARGSVIPAILAHWAINRFAGLDPATAPFTAAVFTVAAAAVIVAGDIDLGRARMLAPPGR